RAVLRRLGDGSRVHQALPRLRATFLRSRLPASWAVADAVVRDGRQHRVDQPRPVLRPRRLDLRGERRHGLLGPLEADLAGLRPLSAAATAITVRSRLYASR